MTVLYIIKPENQRLPIMGRSTNYGFSLLELLIVILIVAIFATLSAPSFKNQHQKSVATSGRNLLFQGLQFARSESITRSALVTICQSDPSVSAVCSSGDWSKGWIIFIDDNGDGAFDGTDDTLLRQYYSVDRINEFKLSNAAEYITFVPNGRARIAGGEDDLTYQFCYLDGSRSAEVTISYAGQTKIEVEGTCS
jgi:type IV fimbrial biogenesis protein FimT